MISLILAIVLFIATIPLKAILLGLRMSLDWYLSRNTPDSEVIRGGIKAVQTGAKVAVQTSKITYKTAKFTYKTTRLAIKLTIFTIRMIIRVVKLLILIIKAIVYICSLLAVSLGFIFLFLILALVAVVGAYLILFKDGGLPTNVNKTQTQEVSTSFDGQGAGNASAMSDGSVMNAIDTLGQYMIDSVGIYEPVTVACPYLSEVDSEGNITKEGTLRADCSGFAQAVVRYLANERGYTAEASSVPLTDSHSIKVHNGAWCRKLESLGWVFLDASQMTEADLQPGDMMVKGGHVEFYRSPTTTFGWGSVKKKLETSQKTVKVGNEFQVGTQTGYVTIYRYVGNGSSSATTEETEEEE